MEQQSQTQPAKDDGLAALKIIQQILVHQANAARRTEELLCFQMEEAVLARKRERQGPKALTATTSQVYSQNYEDAIVSEIFTRIGVTDRIFVEIGVESGIECNTRLLLQQGWRGLWVEGNGAHCNAVRQRFSRELASGQLKLAEVFLTRENVNDVVRSAGFSGTVDFLSVDIDMNTHHIWRQLDIKSRVACIEYNASYPPSMDFEVPYSSNSVWNGSNWFGASLKAFEIIGKAKKMLLVGCEVTGANAFFVGETVAGDKFAAPYDAETHYEPARYHLLKTRGHRRAE